MRNFRIFLMSVAMLMASTSLMAQVERVTTVLEGRGLVGMYGFSCTMTITPDGNGIIKGKSTREMDAVTIKFKAQPSVLYSAIKGTNFMWSYIKDATVSPFTMMVNDKNNKGKKVREDVTPTGSAKFNGMPETSGSDIKFYVRFPMKVSNKQSVFDINFTFNKTNVAKKYQSE